MENDARRTQRLGAYAVVLRTDDSGVEHLLLTRISPVGYPVGWWGLPGGGVDHGEPPGDTVVREVHEETGLALTSAELVEVHDLHVVEMGRADQYEDFHGVHLLYRADVAGDGLPEPRVIDVDGTTDLAAWLPVRTLRDDPPGPMLAALEHVLDGLGRYRSSSGSGSTVRGAPGPAEPSGE